MRVYYDQDCDVNLVKETKIAILGYGSQGHAHALNLRDSGAKNIAVALRENSPSAKKAEAEGLKVLGIEEAAKWCDLMMFSLPDELQAETYKKFVHNNLTSPKHCDFSILNDSAYMIGGDYFDFLFIPLMFFSFSTKKTSNYPWRRLCS